MARGPYSETDTVRVLRALIDFVEGDTPAVPLTQGATADGASSARLDDGGRRCTAESDGVVEYECR